VISPPILANIYLHYCFDLWAKRWRRQEARGDMIVVRYADDLVVGFEHEGDARRFLDAMHDRLGGICTVAPPGQDSLDEFGRFAANDRKLARAWKAGNLRVLGLHLHLWSISPRQLPASTEDPTRPHAGKAEGPSRRSYCVECISRSQSKGNG